MSEKDRAGKGRAVADASARPASAVRAVPRAGSGAELPEDPVRLLAALQIYQVELELQNDELRRSQLELEESRQRYADLFDGAPVGYLVVGQDDTIVEANDTAARLVDSRPEALIGTSCHLLFREQDRDAVYLFLGRARGLSDTEDRPCQVRLKRSGAAGESLHVELAGMAEETGSGRVRMVLTDVSSRVQLDAARTRASRVESLGLLAGGIAHDFNNLLAVVQGNLDLAVADLGTEGQSAKDDIGAALAEASDACRRASDLTQQLLTFSRGGAPLTKAASLPDLLNRSVRFAASGSAVRCELTFADELWPGSVDPGQFSQLIHNLALNAVQAMPDGGTLFVTADNTTLEKGDSADLKPGRYLRIELRDQGPGIPSELAERIFDPYFTTKASGSGLGLASAYSIARRHGGTLELSRRVEPGACFVVWVPAADEAPRDALEPASVEQSRAERSRAEGRILVMDDEPALRRMYTRLLAGMGYDVVTTQDGEEAVQAYRAARKAGRPFDLVLLDLTVPGAMGGKDAMALLRREDPQILGLVSSGYSNDPVLATPADHGFAGRLVKPFSARQVADEVARVLNLRSPPV